MYVAAIAVASVSKRSPTVKTISGFRRSKTVASSRSPSPVDFAIVTTWRTDTYGRYLADLKYLNGEPDPQTVLAEGTYLNRQLLDVSLAVRYLD